MTLELVYDTRNQKDQESPVPCHLAGITPNSDGLPWVVGPCRGGILLFFWACPGLAPGAKTQPPGTCR